ncbi:alpha/beta hydrolase [Ascidiaceihabitans sp.]|uniref:alpha/beta fold hydrolase n=1 Tax=Ascidiaceihabitans sp. TaxID=1872644 RepID=UPI003296C2BB
MYYFHTDRGRFALTENRRDICRFIWSLWSPTWQLSEEIWAATATSFDHPDFVEIVLHSYRHRFGGVPGDPAYDKIEARLATRPKVKVPSIVLQGRDEDVDRLQFTSFYERWIVDSAGHNLPQEAPEAFAAVVLTLPNLE